MSYVDESNFDTAFPVTIRDEYWRRVKYALVRFFHASPEVANRFRASVESSSVLEQLLAYHDDPFTMAADLADARSDMDAYRDAYERAFPDSSLHPQPLPLP